MGNQGLRTSLIWHDEVMSDVVHERPARVTIGSSGDATFTTPNIGSASEYAIVTPGKRGYLLTLSSQMTGTVCLGGVEHDVAAFVRAAEEPGGFRGTPIGGNDWGVIELDAHHKLFFQFVPLEEAEWNLGHPMVVAAVGGFALSALALTGLWWWKGVPLGEAAFRGGSLASLAIGLAAIVRWALRQDNESRASLAFSVMLHAALLFATFQLYEKASPFAWPDRPSMSGGYVVKLDEIKPPPPTLAEKQKPTVAPGARLPERHPWKRPTGKRVEKTVQKIAAAVQPQNEVGKAAFPMPNNQVPKIGVMVHEDILHGIAARDVGGAIAKVGQMGPNGGDGAGPPGPPAVGGGTKNGGLDGKGGPVGQGKKTGDIDTGKPRAAVCVGAGCGDGEGGPKILAPPSAPPDGPPILSKLEIEKVIKAHSGMFTACYQKELDKEPTLSGDVTMHFEIGADGRV